MPHARLLGILALLALACSPPTRDDDPPSNTCPAERVCGDGCCPANQTCKAETNECVSATCTKTTCPAANAQCGAVPDGCGGQLDCGTCAGGAACLPDHTCPGNTCVPKSCDELGKNCGEVQDGCGHVQGCGACSGEDSCGGGGVENVCGHAASTCETNPRSCYQLCVPSVEDANFGTVDVGTSKTFTFHLTNCGEVNFELRAVEVGAGAFSLVSPPTLPVIITPGATLDVLVSFAPTAATHFTATLDVTTSYGITGVHLNGDGHQPPPTCDSATRPTPNVRISLATGGDITANPSVTPPGAVILDAATSSVPRGSPTYAWTLVSKPSGSTSQLMGVTAPSQVTLPLDQLGDYVVGLTITDPTGCASYPIATTVHAVPAPSNQRLRIELTWAQAVGDVDLHLIGPNGTLYNYDQFTGLGSDCFYANCGKSGQAQYTLDWGKNNTTAADGIHTNDPALQADAEWGHGPEVITDDTPFDATYTPAAYFYCSRAKTSTGVSGTSSGPVDATMRIYVDGTLRREFTQQLTQRDKWTPATIVVSGPTVTVNAITTGFLSKTTAQQDACTTDRN